MDNKSIINQLIKVGTDLDNLKTHISLLHMNGYGHINRINKNDWEKEVSGLSTQELVFLIKGLVFAEKELNWYGGSVAGSIWLFKILIDLNVSIQTLDQVSLWVIKNTRNPYNPFGTAIYGNAKNYSEYLLFSRERSIRIRESIENDKEFEKIAELQRDRRKLLRQRSHSLRKTSVRDELIEKL
ncbi:MAG: hypothetical protein P9L94_06675 [Candidatus Hinthialibacter antarcticus]|nr:hypothetical protein [Candidatus Hinthialibacter antarcticus]